MKHRAGGNVIGGIAAGNNNMVLPLTQADLKNGSSTSSALTHRATAASIRPGGAVRVRRVRKKKSSNSGGSGGDTMWGFGTLLSFILAAGLLTAFIQRHAMITIETNNTSSSKKGDDDDALRETVERFVKEEQSRKTGTGNNNSSNFLPLNRFPSLQYALHHSDIVLLYFAASWCPMSTPITKLVDELFSPILLLPPPTSSEEEEEDRERDLEQHQLLNEEKHEKLSLVYVSSDLNKEDFEQYKKQNWMVVPFENANERADIKRHFHTCAKREMDELHMTSTMRQHEIPTLIVLSGATQQVLTFHGIKDIQQAIIHDSEMTDETTSTDAAQANADTAASLVDSWMELNRLSTSLSDKFEIE